MTTIPRHRTELAAVSAAERALATVQDLCAENHMLRQVVAAQKATLDAYLARLAKYEPNGLAPGATDGWTDDERASMQDLLRTTRVEDQLRGVGAPTAEDQLRGVRDWKRE